MEEISLEFERVIPVGSKAKKHNELEGLGYEESGHRGFASSEELNATKESLQSQIDTNANAIKTLSEGIDPEKIDGIKDLIDYVEEHQVDVVSIQEGIEQNASDIDELEGSVSSIDERVTALEESGSSTEPSGEPLVATFDIASANTSVTVKNLTGATSVDWGDSTPIQDISSVTTYTHTYESVGSFVAKFYGNITELGYEAFNGNIYLYDIILPISTTSIGENCFYGCTNMRSIKIAEFVSHIGARAFISTKLTIMQINAITPPTLGVAMFTNVLNSPSKIIVPYISLEQYKTASGWSTYASRIEAYTPSSVVEGIDERVTALEEGGGGGDTEELEKRVDNLELLHQDPLVATFNITTASTAITVKNLTGATMVDWGDGSEIEDISVVTTYTHTYETTGTYEARFYGEITTIGEKAFDSARRLRSIYIPNTIGTIENYAFQQQSLLKYVDFAYDINLTQIGMGAFSACSKLINIEIPQTVQTIGQSAFEYCEVLSDIRLPVSLTQKGLGRYAFNGCRALNTLLFPYKERNENDAGSLSEIPDGAFQQCYSIKEVIIPSRVMKIASQAFLQNRSIESIHIYFSMNGISLEGPFGECYNLKRIILDKISRENIGAPIILTKALFPDKGTLASNDRVLEIRSDTPPTITGIEYIQDDIKIIVPRGSLELYKNAEGWKDKASQIDCEITANDVYALVGNINTELANIIEGEGV